MAVRVDVSDMSTFTGSSMGDGSDINRISGIDKKQRQM